MHGSNDTTVLLIGTIGMLALTIFLIIFIIFQLGRSAKSRALFVENQFNQEMLKTKIEIKEQVLRNISQEIHDNIGQVLSIVKLNINMIKSEDSVTNERLDTSSEMLGKSITELRTIARKLDSDYYLENGLIKSIQHDLKVIENSGAISVKYSVEGLAFQFPPSKEVIIYRIFQEAVNNIIKHSSAKLIQVKVTFLKRRFTIEISDDEKVSIR